MVDRAFVNEAAQWAIEATAGTAETSGFKTVRSMSIDLSVEGEADIYRPDGHNWGQLVIPNAEWSSWSFDGRPSYTEILYLLESIFGTAVSTTTAGSTGKIRTYTPSDTAADTAKTLTIEKGSSARAAKIAYGLVTDHALSFSRRKGVTMTGKGIGQLLTDGITMTASPSDVALVPIVGKQLDFYVDSSAAGLGTTKLLRAFSLAPSVSDKYSPVWPINSALASFAGHVQTAPKTKYDIMLEADSAGMAYLTQFRAGTTIFAEIRGTGAEYESGHSYSFKYQACLGINKINDYGKDDDGVTTLKYEAELVKDSTWTKAVNVIVESAVASL